MTARIRKREIENSLGLVLARTVTMPRHFEAEKVSDGARRVEQSAAEHLDVKIIGSAFDALYYKAVNRVFGNEPNCADRRRDYDINVSLLAF